MTVALVRRCGANPVETRDASRRLHAEGLQLGDVALDGRLVAPRPPRDNERLDAGWTPRAVDIKSQLMQHTWRSRREW